MSRLYSSPIRVYLCLAILAVAGIFCGTSLPVSLFPNSNKPKVNVSVGYGNGTAADFISTYGYTLEGQLRGLSTDDLEIDQLTANYGTGSVSYGLEFKWGTQPKTALREVENTVYAFAGRFPREIRDSVNVYSERGNTGFFAMSFYSEKRGLDELYHILDPILTPQLARIPDASGPVLYNPNRKEVRVELIPEKMATLQVFPGDIEGAIAASSASLAGGSVMVGTQSLQIEMPGRLKTLDELSRIPIPTRAQKLVHLSDVARIDFGPKTTDSQSFKTNGAPSLILFSRPKAGGNVKRMSEDILASVRAVMTDLPKDIEYKVLVDPSEFIRSSVNNVFHEVVIGACLAVAVLFLFIGSFRNVVTAAIEIPMSMVLAFILMKLSGMNLNLISLGGLALAAGMNVDASVVVMENIFRHFEDVRGKTDLATRLRIISQAVAEVRFAVISSTIASLVVFLPLIFTSNLSSAILGDLAKTVVFSHAFSAIVALILVPTVRLQLMSANGGIVEHPRSPIESALTKVERTYGRLLEIFLRKPKLKASVYLGLATALAALLWLVLPALPKEVIGKPDTDWMVVSVNTSGNTLMRQMESQIEEVEAKLLDKFGSRIQYTFTEIEGSNSGEILARLKDKSQMRAIWKEMEDTFTNTPFMFYWVGPWNPAELPIPNPPQLKIAFRGGSDVERARAVQEVNDSLESDKVFPSFWTEPGLGHSERVVLKPNLDQWVAFQKQSGIGAGDLLDLARVATSGRALETTLPVDGIDTGIVMSYPQKSVSSVEEIAALPIGVGSRLVPLKSLMSVGIETSEFDKYRENGKEVYLLYGQKKENEELDKEAALRKAEKTVEGWRKSHPESRVTVYFEDAEKEINDAIHQLGLATGLSILLILFTLVIQFGSFVNAVLVLVAIPLGLIGVLASLFIFRSTLSLNSILGVILLNGIAVANSIILVDFIKRLVDRDGLDPETAAVEAGRKRLRPILITSLTTILGMLPVALGMGEGGRILQPLGIAVSGGLWISMTLTLFVVPALQVSYLNWKARRAPRPEPRTGAQGPSERKDETPPPGLTIPPLQAIQAEANPGIGQLQ